MMNLCVAGALAACSAVCQAQAVSDKPAAADYHSDPKFVAAYAKASQGKHDSANLIDIYKKANKIAGGQCVECLSKTIPLQVQLRQWKDVAATAAALQKIAPKPQDQSDAASWVGYALQMQESDHPKTAQLEAIDTAYSDSIRLDSRNAVALYMDGIVLAQMDKYDEAKARFAATVNVLAPSDVYARRAKRFMQDPKLAKNKMVPAFEVKTLAGKTFSLDDMGGKVVLIDFWATWCGPCNEELPHVQKIARDFANEPFELISVSWDSDDAAWRQFVTKHEMTWNQYRDANHQLSEAFAVDAIPHYFTIDSDGVLRAEVLGSGEDVEGKLKKLIAAAKAEAAKNNTTPIASAQ